MNTTPSTYSPRLHLLCVAFAVCTYPLLISGGSVTSHAAGMSVPDWPTSFGYNMFFLPFDKWISADHGAVFLEHSHRLFASLIGLICIAITAIVWGTQASRPWVRKLAALLLVLVILQGIMGGFRVTQISYVLAIIHGVHAQIFFCLTILLACATSPVWHAMADRTSDRIIGGPDAVRLRRLAVVLLLVIFLQLILGACVRHTQSALAIYDFPTSYGGILPPMSPEAVKQAQLSLPVDHHRFSTYSIGQVHLAFGHRVGAVLVLIASALLIARLAKAFPTEPRVRRPIFAFLGLLALQVSLGATVIWSAKQAEVATAHQAVGAALAGVATLLAIRIFLFTKPVPAAQDATNSVPSNSSPGNIGDSQPQAVASHVPR